MSTKALKSQLLAAIAMTLVAAIALGSSTYAWFAANTRADATGMQVTVRSDSTFLLINTGDNDTASEIQNAGVSTVALEVTPEQSKLFPASPALESHEVAYLTVAADHYKIGGDTIVTPGVQVTNQATASTVTNWFTANALTVASPTIDTATARQLENFTGYVIQKTAYLTVAAGSNPANNLGVAATITQKTGGVDVTAVKVLVTTDDGGFAVLSTTNPSGDIKGLNTNITNSTVRTVNIYIYYDGDDTQVYTNNAANLTGADISLAFTVDPVSSGS